MSQGRADSEDAPGSNLGRAGRELSQMIVEGRSFSGNERNCMFLNTGATPAAEGRFACISAVSGLDFPDDARAVALVDWDHDGDQDMWISNRNAPRLRLMRNETPRTNHYLSLRLEGDGTTTNRDAIGARVELVLAGGEAPDKDRPRSVKTLRAGEGFLAQSSKWLHFGLGAAEEIAGVTVHWPGGETEEFTGLAPDHRYHLTQGTGTPQKAAARTATPALVPSVQAIPKSTQVARVPLVELLTAPPAPYTGFNGEKHTLSPQPGRLLLVNLWASWCAPCQLELNEFAKHHEDLQGKGIDILALSIDALGQNPSTRENAAKLVNSRDFPFPTGEATDALVNEFQSLHNLHVSSHEKLPLPSSFLIDREGRLSVFYKGPVSVETLLDDTAHSDADRLGRFASAAPLPGSLLRHPEIARTAVESAVAVRLEYGLGLQGSGRTIEAATLYTDALDLEPDNPLAHHYLGLIRHNQGREADAIRHLGEAVRLKPDYSEAHNSYGIALLGKGDAAQAIHHFQQALELQPGYAAAHNSLGVTFLRQKKFADAIEHFHLALRTEPKWTSVHENLGLSLQGLAARLLGQPFNVQNGQPDHPTMHAALGNALRDRGDFARAAQHYQWALHLNPDLPPALNNLAWIRATHPNPDLRDGTRAVQLAERCCMLTNHQLNGTLDTLAAAYAEVGRFDDAIRWQIKAIELAGAADTSELKKQLEFYRAGKPWRK